MFVEMYIGYVVVAGIVGFFVYNKWFKEKK